MFHISALQSLLTHYSLLAQNVPDSTRNPAGTTIIAQASSILDGYNLIYEQDFENQKALNDFVFANPDNWSIAKHEGNGVLELSGESQHKPTVNSRHKMALLVWRWAGDFVLECDIMSSCRTGSKREMCLVFNFQDPGKYYYSSIFTQSYANTNKIFIVANKPGEIISEKMSLKIAWKKNQ